MVFDLSILRWMDARRRGSRHNDGFFSQQWSMWWSPLHLSPLPSMNWHVTGGFLQPFFPPRCMPLHRVHLSIFSSPFWLLGGCLAAGLLPLSRGPLCLGLSFLLTRAGGGFVALGLDGGGRRSARSSGRVALVRTSWSLPRRVVRIRAFLSCIILASFSTCSVYVCVGGDMTKFSESMQLS